MSRNKEFGDAAYGRLHEIREFDGVPHQLVGWHMTHDPEFKHDPKYTPSDYVGVAAGKGDLFYTIDPHNWGRERYRRSHAAEVWKRVRPGSKVGDKNPVKSPDWNTGSSQQWDEYFRSASETPNQLDLDEYSQHEDGDTMLRAKHESFRIGAVMPAGVAERLSPVRERAEGLQREVGDAYLGRIDQRMSALLYSASNPGAPVTINETPDGERRTVRYRRAVK